MRLFLNLPSHFLLQMIISNMVPQNTFTVFQEMIQRILEKKNLHLGFPLTVGGWKFKWLRSIWTVKSLGGAWSTVSSLPDKLYIFVLPPLYGFCFTFTSLVWLFSKLPRCCVGGSAGGGLLPLLSHSLNLHDPWQLRAVPPGSPLRLVEGAILPKCILETTKPSLFTQWAQEGLACGRGLW